MLYFDLSPAHLRPSAVLIHYLKPCYQIEAKLLGNNW